MDRSYQSFKRGQQLYAVIEFCRDPETLWSKLASGHWDWLGVRQRDGQRHFVLGRPPISRMRVFGAGTVSEVGTTSVHRTTISTPDRPDKPSERWYRSAADAADGFDTRVRELTGERGSSGLFRVRLYEGATLVREHLVVRAWPNEL